MKTVFSVSIQTLAAIMLLFSFSASAGDIKAKWSTAGKLGGKYKHCIAINEPAEPKANSWEDNYLCFNKPNHGYNYSYGGKISGLTCHSMNIKGGAWVDNYICGVSNNFNYFPRKLPGGYRCIRLIEPADDHPRANGSKGYSNHFCIKK